jgi:hypothetical protein
MKKSLMVSLVATVIILGTTTLLWAPDPGEPPSDPGKPCSPGYWKNHSEVWVGTLCTTDCAMIMADLRAKGPGSGAVRHAASAYLNSQYVAMVGTPLPCNDD